MKKIFWTIVFFLFCLSLISAEEEPKCSLSAGDIELGGFRIFQNELIPDWLGEDPLPVYVEENKKGFFVFKIDYVGNTDLSRLKINKVLSAVAEDNTIFFSSGDLTWGYNQIEVVTSGGSIFFSIVLEKLEKGQSPKITYY